MEKKKVTARLRELLDQRERVGIERYGVSLHTFNGRSCLRDAVEEAVDLTQYLLQAELERTQLLELARETLLSFQHEDYRTALGLLTELVAQLEAGEYQGQDEQQRPSVYREYTAAAEAQDPCAGEE